MPAGKYTIGINVEQKTIELTDAAQKKSVFILGTPAGDGQYDWKLVFNKVGDRYALKEMESDAIDLGFHTVLPHGELMGQLIPPQRVEIALNRG